MLIKSAAFLIIILELFMVPNTFAEKNYAISMELEYLYGSIDGYIQTPKGGNTGTTEIEEPSFDELGVDKGSTFNIYTAVDWKKHCFLGGVQQIDITNSKQLSTNILFKDTIFQQGEPIRADVNLSWYRLGYMYRLTVIENRFKKLELSIGMDTAVLHYSCTIDGLTDTAHRSYNKSGYRPGGELTYNPSEKFSISAQIFTSLPISNTIQILNCEIDSRYQLGNIKQTEWFSIIGIDYTRIDYKDDQSVPNHINAYIGPMIKAGIGFKF